MQSIIIYNGENTQVVTITLVDSDNNPISGAEVSGALMRNGADLEGGSITFTAVEDSPGTYSGTLSAFDAPVGASWLVVTGAYSGNSLTEYVFTTIAQNQF